MSCRQIIFFWFLLRRRLQAANDDVVYSSVSSRGWTAALSLPRSTNQEAVSCGSLCKSVWWSCGSTLTLYRTIRKLQRDEPKLQLCAACVLWGGGSHECSSVQTGTLSISGITHSRIICFWAPLSSPWSAPHSLCYSTSLFSQSSGSWFDTRVWVKDPAHFFLQRSSNQDEEKCNNADFILVRVWAAFLWSGCSENKSSNFTLLNHNRRPHAAWSEPSDLHTIHFYSRADDYVEGQKASSVPNLYRCHSIHLILHCLCDCHTCKTLTITWLVVTRLQNLNKRWENEPNLHLICNLIKCFPVS